MKRYVIQVYLSKEEKQLIQITAIKIQKKDSDFCREIILKWLKDMNFEKDIGG